MVRGYQKKVVFLKNIGSDMFDEAYFIMGDDKEKDVYQKDDLIKECERIIEENLGDSREILTPKVRFLSFIKRHLLSFCAGAALGVGVSVIILFL